MKNLLLFLAIIGLLSGCVTQKKCYKKFPPQVTSVHDSIQTVEKVPIYIKGDTVIQEVPIQDCPDQQIAIFENSLLKQQVEILNGKLKIKTETKPKTDTVYQFKTTVKTVTKEVPKEVQVKYIPKWVKWLAWIGTFAIIGALLYIYLKFRTKLLKK